MKTVQPYLNFAGNTEEAFRFYCSVFDTEIQALIRFRDMGGKEMGVPEEDLDKIMHIALPLGKEHMLMATDTLESLGQNLIVGNNTSIMLGVETEEEAHRLFDGLAGGGTPQMPLQRVEWAEAFGMCTDKYGVQWLISYQGDVEFVPPPVQEARADVGS